MYYTGINPLSGKRVFVATDYHEKQLQRALLQYNRPQNADAVREALVRAGREDLIGTAPHCLVRPKGAHGEGAKPYRGAKKSDARGAQKKKAPVGGERKTPTRGAKNGAKATAPARKNMKRSDKRR